MTVRQYLEKSSSDEPPFLLRKGAHFNSSLMTAEFSKVSMINMISKVTINTMISIVILFSIVSIVNIVSIFITVFIVNIVSILGTVKIVSTVRIFSAVSILRKRFIHSFSVFLFQVAINIMYIINQEGVLQAHYLKYINQEKTLLNMKERETQEEVQHHVGRLQ